MKFEKETINIVKNKLVKTLCKKVEHKIKESKLQLAKLLQAASEAPGAMQSQHCGLKAEFSRLASNMQDKINQLQKDFEFLQSYKVEDLNKEIVLAGSLVEVNHDSEKKFYFVFPVCGGEIVELKDLNEKIIVVTLRSPLGDSLLNKKVGHSLKIRDKDLKIINIF